MYELIVVLAVIISWLPLDRFPRLRALPRGLVDPVLVRIRRSVPVTAGAIDFSPFVLVLMLEVMRQLLRRVAG